MTTTETSKIILEMTDIEYWHIADALLRKQHRAVTLGKKGNRLAQDDGVQLGKLFHKLQTQFYDAVQKENLRDMGEEV